MSTEAQERQRFGERIVCDHCGIPLPPEKFEGDNILCVDCHPQVIAQHNVAITPEDRHKSGIQRRLEEARETADPSVIKGYERAEEMLGMSPQEVQADAILSLKNPGHGRADLTEEQRAALPVDWKTIAKYTGMLQQAQFHRDQQLLESNTTGDATPEQLRATVLKGVLDHVDQDRDLRMQLIRGFSQRCSTFFDEVMQVAREMNVESSVGAIT